MHYTHTHTVAHTLANTLLFTFAICSVTSGGRAATKKKKMKQRITELHKNGRPHVASAALATPLPLILPCTHNNLLIVIVVAGALFIRPPSLPFAAVLRLLNVTLRICQRASPKPVAAQCPHLHALLPLALLTLIPCNILWCYLTSVWHAGLAMTLRSALFCAPKTQWHLSRFGDFTRSLYCTPLLFATPFPCLHSFVLQSFVLALLVIVVVVVSVVLSHLVLSVFAFVSWHFLCCAC